MRIVFLGAAALLWCGAAFAGNPSYSPDGMRNASNGAPGPFAPNSIVTLHGSGMAWAERALAASDISDGSLPISLGGVQIRVNGWNSALLYVSENQVNFLIPGNMLAGDAKIQLSRQGLAGPEIAVQLKDVAPALFPLPSAPQYAVAQSWPGYSLIDQDHPTSSGGIVILYATGLGRTERFPSPLFNEIPQLPGLITAWEDFHVYFDGVPLDRDKVWYAGICPNWVGLYQINFLLPPGLKKDPEIRIGIGDQLSPAGTKLSLQ